MATKIVFCLTRRPELSREEFQAYWRDVHAPLVRSRASLLGIRRYVQSHTTDEAGFAALARARGAPAAFDGVAEIWFEDSREGSPEQRLAAARELVADERKFIDLAASPIFHALAYEAL